MEGAVKDDESEPTSSRQSASAAATVPATGTARAATAGPTSLTSSQVEARLRQYER